MNDAIKIMIQAAQAGGAVLKKYFGQQLDIKEKATVSDFQTKADVESEQAIVAMLSQNFPNYNIHAEEQGIIDKKSEYTFVIDPLDGSNNFVIGIPYFSIGIALQKRQETILAVIHNPITNYTYYAEKGKGVYLENKKLRVNQEANVKRANVAYVTDYIHSEEYNVQLIKRLHQDKQVKRILWNWSPCLDFCLLAAGKIEAIIVNKIELYDYAAGKLMVREAGALITDWQGKRDDSDSNDKFLASNGTKIHQELLEIL